MRRGRLPVTDQPSVTPDCQVGLLDGIGRLKEKTCPSDCPCFSRRLSWVALRLWSMRLPRLPHRLDGLPAGSREAQPRVVLSHQTREIRVVPRLMRRFGEVSNHTGEDFTPSERDTQCLPQVGIIQVNYLASVEYSPIRLHLLDPQRRDPTDSLAKGFRRLAHDGFNVGTLADAQVRGAQPGVGRP